MKKIISISFLMFILTSSLYGYVDMSDTASRANDLNMTQQDYAFAMAIAGTMTGSIFALFLWKAK